MKNILNCLIICSSFFLASCSSNIQINEPETNLQAKWKANGSVQVIDESIESVVKRGIPKQHKELLNTLKINTPSKQNTMDGYWFMTVQKKDLHLYPWATLDRAMNSNGSVITAGVKHDGPEDSITYVGFIKINGESGTHILSNTDNKKASYKIKKREDGLYHWLMELESGTGQGKPVPQKIEDIAFYDKSKDMIFGKASTGLEFTFNHIKNIDNLNDPNSVELKTRDIPVVTYFWRATRIAEADYLKYSQPNKVNITIPLNRVSLDFKNSHLEEILYSK